MAGLDSFHQKVGKWFNALSCCKDVDEDEWKPVIGKPFDFRREDPCIAGLSSEEQETLRMRAVSDATRMFATLQPIQPQNNKINKSSRTTIPSPRTCTPHKPSFSTSLKSSTSIHKPAISIGKITTKNKGWITGGTGNNTGIGNSDVTYTLSPSLLEPNRPTLPRQNSSHSGKGGGVGVGGKGIRPLALITDTEILDRSSNDISSDNETARNSTTIKNNTKTPDNESGKLLKHSRGVITSPSPKTAGYASLHTISTGPTSGRTPLLDYGDLANSTPFFAAITGSAVTSPFDIQMPGHGQGRYEMNLLPSPVSSRLEGLDFDFGSFSGRGGGVGRDAEGFAVSGGREDVFGHDDGKADGNAERDQDRDSGKYVRGR